MMIMIFSIGLLLSVLAGYLCFGLANAFFHVHWLNWLFAGLGFGIILLCTFYILFGNQPPDEQKQPSQSRTMPFLLGAILGSWLNKK